MKKNKQKEGTSIDIGANSKGAVKVGEQQTNNKEGSDAGGEIVSVNNNNSPQEGANIMGEDKLARGNKKLMTDK